MVNQKKRKAPNRRGEIIGERYRIDHTISMGGMGCVYLATQTALGRHVAIKILLKAADKHQKEFQQRFVQEVTISSRLHHPNIITVHDYGIHNGNEPYMVMEYVDGEPLSSVIHKMGRVPLIKTIDIALQVCSALRTAHKAGVVHRDLKPGNIMISPSDEHQDFVKVLDFGLAKRFISKANDDDIVHITATGQWRGSVRYMSPEQISGRSIDHRSDIYSLGVVMYHMIAGQVPFNGKNVEMVLLKHMHENPPLLRDVIPPSEYSQHMDAIVQRCLRKDPNDRFRDARELADALHEAKHLATPPVLHSQWLSNPDTGPLFSTQMETSNILFAPSSSHTRSMAHPLSGLPAPLSEVAFAPPSSSLFSDLRATVASAVITSIAVSVMVWTFWSRTLRINSTVPTVEFQMTSQPPDAEVSRNGRAIGYTPFTHQLSVEEIDTTATYVFKKRGYQDLSLTTVITSTLTTVHGALRALRSPSETSRSVNDRK